VDRNARIFVAGGKTLIGAALLRQLAAQAFTNVVGQPPDEPDLCSAAEVDDFFSCFRPECVLFTAGKSGGIEANRLFPADLIIDNQCPPGDCVVELEGLEWRTGPVSTITGAMIINMIRCATAEALLARGVKPVVLPSHQFVANTSAATQLEAFYEAYRKSLKHLFE
jgi:uncharacterized phosphosugar-binding protein